MLSEHTAGRRLKARYTISILSMCLSVLPAMPDKMYIQWNLTHATTLFSNKLGQKIYFWKDQFKIKNHSAQTG